MVATVQAPSKKKSSPTTAKGAATPTHPKTSVMVMAAINELNEKNGSSLAAIKKYISVNHNLEPAKVGLFIRKFLKASVIKGTLVQCNGVGAHGRFKRPVVVKKNKPVVSKKPSAVKKAVAAKKPPPKVAVSAVGTPKKRKLTAKEAKSDVAESTAKKPKKVATTKPKKSLVKAKKTVAAPKPPKVVKKTTAVKQTKSPKKK